MVQSYLPDGANVHPHLAGNTFPWAHPSPHRKQHLGWFSHFCSTHGRVSIYFTMHQPFSLQNCPFRRSRGDLDPSNTLFLEPTQVLTPNGISIGSAIFAGLTIVTDRPCYSVCSNWPYLRSTVMYLKNPSKGIWYLQTPCENLPLCVVHLSSSSAAQLVTSSTLQVLTVQYSTIAKCVTYAN